MLDWWLRTICAPHEPNNFRRRRWRTAVGLLGSGILVLGGLGALMLALAAAGRSPFGPESRAVLVPGSLILTFFFCGRVAQRVAAAKALPAPAAWLVAGTLIGPFVVALAVFL